MITFDLTSVSPMGAAYVQVLDRARAEIGEHLDDPGFGAPTAVRKAATPWRQATVALDEIHSALTSLAQRAWDIATDRDLTTQATAARITAAAAEARSQVDRLAADVRAKLTQMTDILARAAVPPRPGDTATDEARIQGVKTDLRMVLDAVPAEPAALAERIAALLERAQRDGDQHTVYVLAATRWPADYVAARYPAAVEYAERLITAHIDQVLDRTSGDELAEVRRVYRAVTGANGVNAITTVLAQLPSLIGAVSDWARSRAGAAVRW